FLTSSFWTPKRWLTALKYAGLLRVPESPIITDQMTHGSTQSDFRRMVRVLPTREAQTASAGSATYDSSHPSTAALCRTNSAKGPGRLPVGKGTHGGSSRALTAAFGEGVPPAGFSAGRACKSRPRRSEAVCRKR